MRRAFWLTLPACLVVARAASASAQAPTGGPDSLRLGALHQQAVANDARQRQFALLAEQTDLRLRNLSAERLPSISA